MYLAGPLHPARAFAAHRSGRLWRVDSRRCPESFERIYAVPLAANMSRPWLDLPSLPLIRNRCARPARPCAVTTGKPRVLINYENISTYKPTAFLLPSRARRGSQSYAGRKTINKECLCREKYAEYCVAIATATLYFIISEGSRLFFPPRNLVPVL